MPANVFPRAEQCTVPICADRLKPANTLRDQGAMGSYSTLAHRYTELVYRSQIKLIPRRVLECISTDG